jgi:mycothiol synthase
VRPVVTPLLVGRLDDEQVKEVHGLVEEVVAHDGHPPLSDHVLLHLPRGGDHDVRHLLVRDGDELVGYAHLDVTDAVDGSSGELAVRPSARRRGVGRALVEGLLQQTPDGRLRLWAHGEHPAASALARALGFRAGRVLWQMRRPLADALPETAAPEGVTLRAFVPGRDEAAWVEVNARAFADHPDQGSWTVDDVVLRERESWFDPAGFFLAEREGRLVGFHWTKTHGGSDADHDHDPVGEVYVVGVDPSEQGRGLGPWLTLVGLHHLRDRGLPEAMLYVDESNTNAIRVYERLGFTRAGTDVSWVRG